MDGVYDSSERERLAGERWQAIQVLNDVWTVRRKSAWVFLAFGAMYPYMFGGQFRQFLSIRHWQDGRGWGFDHLTALTFAGFCGALIWIYWLALRPALTRLYMANLVGNGLLARAQTVAYAGVARRKQESPPQDHLWLRMLWLARHYYEACRYYQLRAYPLPALVAELALPTVLALLISGVAAFVIAAMVAPAWTGKADLGVGLLGFLGSLVVVSLSVVIKRLHSTLLIELLLHSLHRE